jgi:SAM-dependent methyltransferase
MTVNVPMLEELLRRKPIVPWSSDPKIRERSCIWCTHASRALSQQHDRASRRFETIDSHVLWIHQTFCGAKPGSSILDLACGPGFYTSRLAELGHDCVGGISLRRRLRMHARSRSERSAMRLPTTGPSRSWFMPDFDVVLFASGELNTFPPSEGQAIVDNARRAFAPRRLADHRSSF